MGLLDSIVGGVLGGGGQQQGGGSEVLLRILMSMLTQGGQRGGADAGLDGLGSVFGGAGGAGGGGFGGLGGLLEKLQQNGLGDAAASWVSTGPNQPVQGDALQQVFGPDTIAQIAAQLGLSQQDTLGQISQMLPAVVDRLTPDGRVPERIDADAGQLGDLIGSMLKQ